MSDKGEVEVDEIDALLRNFGRAVCLHEPITGADAVDAIAALILRVIQARNTSPEITKGYLCPECGNRTEFIGIDSDGFPGFQDDCACGYVADESGDVCTCTAVLRQPFTVDELGNEDYHLFTVDQDGGGGRNAEIGAYDRIVCAKCAAIIWEEGEDTNDTHPY